jgi:hypothetical protein
MYLFKSKGITPAIFFPFSVFIITVKELLKGKEKKKYHKIYFFLHLFYNIT